MTYKKSICNKHDDAMSELKRLDKIYFNIIEDVDFSNSINDVIGLIEDAKTDGMKMESGLDEKRNRIKQLEHENEKFIDKISDLESKIGELQSKFEGIETLLSEQREY